MGDRNRFLILADFIHRNFKPCNVADVAGGNGFLSYYLNIFGFNSSVIDPRKSSLPREFRNKVKINYSNNKFTSQIASNFDLVIGLHPDGATKEICKSALIKPIVIIPCCNYWNEEQGNNIYSKCINFLKNNRISYWETTLSMSGKNNVIITYGVK